METMNVEDGWMDDKDFRPIKEKEELGMTMWKWM